MEFFRPIVGKMFVEREPSTGKYSKRPTLNSWVFKESVMGHSFCIHSLRQLTGKFQGENTHQHHEKIKPQSLSIKKTYHLEIPYSHLNTELSRFFYIRVKL